MAKEAQDVGSDSLQSAHDPDVTYSGHKGKGYSVQVSETCGEGNASASAKEGVNLLAQAVERLRRQEASPRFKERHKIRSGIESTHAELKGAHGLKKLRVGRKRR